ncbi:MAG TPA: secretin N-terminal domain-containing protein, partial [Phycisphaerae bacterium]|nr:secretin N-terminal domain-containing protein [Phycisphaerae bacterium]
QAELAVNNTVRIVPLVVVADARTNTLLVAGGKENFAAVEAMIEKLDAAEAMGLNEFRIFKLVHATAGSVQPMLQKLFDQRVTRGQTKDPVTILADTRSNTLVVGASPEDMKLVESILARMDVAEDKVGRAQRVFLLEKADATQVSNTLKELFKGQAGESGVSISVDERINAIVVSAGRTDLERIAELVAQFDTEKVTHVTEIRVFTLANADATELGQILTDALTNKPKAMTARSQNLQTWLRFVATSPDGKELVTSALQEGVLITPDPRTNSLVVSAPRSSMPLLASMIQSLDMTSPRTAEIRVFTLTNADATQMADVLRAMFRQSAQGAAGGKTAKAVNYTLASATTQPADGATTEASATVGSAEQEALNITVDSRTNSLLVGGTRQYVQLAAKIIEELDSSPAQERVTKIYRLRNALATDIEKALRAFLDQERQRIVSTLGAQAVGAAQRLLEREVAVVSVGTEGQTQNTNTLLLSASPRYFQTIEEMIKELDQPPPQVLVQVLLAEITLDDTTDLGFEWTLEKKVENSTVQTHTNFSVAAAIAKSDSGLGISVTGGDLNFFLRALQSQGKLEVLSRPQILASDNQKATINVGQRVPFITNSRVTESGTTLNTIQYEPVGIILDVTPRINPDGFVRLEVAPQISSLSTSSVDISEGVKAIIVNERKAETTVTVQDGHTVVLGGLITTRDENRESKVPVLGDIP